MLIIQDLFDFCQKVEKSKKIFLIIKTKEDTEIRIPMVKGHYIVDNIWCSQVCKTIEDIKNASAIDSDSFIEELEQECLNYPNDWGTLYTSPMEDICGLRLDFYYDIVNGYDKGLTHFEGTEIKEDEENIYIYIKEN